MIGLHRLKGGRSADRSFELMLKAQLGGGHLVRMQFIALFLPRFATLFFGRGAFLRFKATL
jgi:hypothetical protein